MAQDFERNIARNIGTTAVTIFTANSDDAALQVLDGGAKFVLQSGDALKVQSDTATSIDAWVSRVDTISS